MRNRLIIAALCALIMASCAGNKTATREAEPAALGANAAASFVSKVVSNGVNADNIVGNASVTLKLGSKDITVPGALRMRRDKVIRLQLFIPLLGTEVGRLEFTPDYVLVLDRMHRQYVKGDYNQLDFLRDNGINFYSLQALFWNQLIVPGKNRVTAADAAEYVVEMNGTNAYVPMTLSKGRMKYTWNASRTDNTLTSAVITYNSTSAGTSMLSWYYSNFTNIGKQKFPRTQQFNFQTLVKGKNQQGDIKINMNEVKTSSDWEAETEISSKYRQVSAEEAMSMLMSF